MSQWSMSNVPGWKGLKPSSTNSLLIIITPLLILYVSSGDPLLILYKFSDNALYGSSTNHLQILQSSTDLLNILSWQLSPVSVYFWLHSFLKMRNHLLIQFSLQCPFLISFLFQAHQWYCKMTQSWKMTPLFILIIILVTYFVA